MSLASLLAALPLAEAERCLMHRLGGRRGSEKPQLELLLHAVRAAVPAPFARLPAAPALALAEASAALAAPGAPLFAPLNKLLLRGDAPDLAVRRPAANPSQRAVPPWLLQRPCCDARRCGRAPNNAPSAVPLPWSTPAAAIFWLW